MRKLFYVILSLILIMPFYVKAEDGLDQEQRSITVNCSKDYAVVSEGELYSCSGSVTKKSSDTSAKVEINNGSNDNLVIGAITDGIVSIDFGYNNTGSFSFTVTNKVPVLTDTAVRLGITAIFNDDQTQTISVDNSILTLKASTSSNPSNPTIPATPTTPENSTSSSTNNQQMSTSKGITNPNTADLNILQLSLIGILFIFIMILSIRKINLLKNSR
ncbi:MAG: hypothetical protein ACI4OT_01955 [Bacilli bacterium]